MSNFSEYLTTLECAQSLADTIHELDQLWARKLDEFRDFARSKNMPWLAEMSGTQINITALTAALKHYERNHK